MYCCIYILLRLPGHRLCAVAFLRLVLNSEVISAHCAVRAPRDSPFGDFSLLLLLFLFVLICSLLGRGKEAAWGIHKEGLGRLVAVLVFEMYNI